MVSKAVVLLVYWLIVPGEPLKIHEIPFVDVSSCSAAAVKIKDALTSFGDVKFTFACLPGGAKGITMEPTKPM